MNCDQERQTILKQIVDLKRFQLNEESDHSTKINGHQEKDSSSSVYHTLEKLDAKFNQQTQNSQDLATNLLEEDNPSAELNPETFSSAFSQLDNLSSSSVMDLPLHGELFWTCKSPLQSNQVRYLSVHCCEPQLDHWLYPLFFKILTSNYKLFLFALCFGEMRSFGAKHHMRLDDNLYENMKMFAQICNNCFR